MKLQERIEGAQAMPTSDRAFSDHNAVMKSRGVSNAGGQRSDQTSNRDNNQKVTRRKRLL